MGPLEPTAAQLKNDRIKETIKKTRERRKGQRCRVFQLKIDKSHLSQQALKHLTTLFLQAKWLTNAVIASEDIFLFDSKVKEVSVKVGEKDEIRSISLLSSQMKQGLVTQIQQDVRNLALKKAQGHKVGRLKFKKAVRTIPLKQYKKTYHMQWPNRIRIQGLKRWIRVRGLNQIPPDAECANAQLLTKHGDFFVHVTTFIPKRVCPVPNQAIGIDFGIKHQLTLSNHIQIDYAIPIPKRVRRLYQRLARKQQGSQNSLKLRQFLHKAFAKWTNRKLDVTNQLTSRLTTYYQYICFQNDPISHWQRLWGRHILNTNLGALLTALTKRSVTPCLVNQWTATTKRCSRCGFVLEQPMELAARVFSCPACRYTGDRDVNAACCIEQLGLASLSQFSELPTGRRKVTPLEISTATRHLVDLFNQVSFVRASVVDE